MPDTTIDLSEGIQSVRLKVPTAAVPIPPAGFAQLHSPAPGELALRLPDGSVVAVGGGGAPPTSLHGPYGSQVNLDATDPTVGVLLGIAPGQRFVIDPPVFPVDIFGKPLGVQVATVPISSAELLALDTVPKVLVAAQGVGRVIVPLTVVYRYLPNTAPYTVAAQRFTLHYGGDLASPQVDDVDAGGLVDDLNPRIGLGQAQSQTSYLITDAMNLPVELLLTAAIGDGDGTMVVTIAYLVV